MAKFLRKTAVSAVALMALGIAGQPGASLRFTAGPDRVIELPLSLVSAARAATRKKVAKKKAATGTTKRVCSTKKVKGKLVNTCKTVTVVKATAPLAPPVVVTAVVPA
ncbi:MAG: hypothetical protein ABL912_10480, partial [Novosphingobium sp.]